MSKRIEDLDKYNYSIESGFNGEITRVTYETLLRFTEGRSCLELGCADGLGTKFLLDKFEQVTAVDGSFQMLEKLDSRLGSQPKLKIVHSYFEELDLPDKFDTIIMTHVLEHVADPVEVLKVAKRHAHENTAIIIEVPNAKSIHRLAGTFMGMIVNPYYLNDADKSVGHRRVYDMDKLKKDVEKAGLGIKHKGGFLLKPFSNQQMQTIMANNPKMVDAYARLGEMYPEIAAEIYIVCKIKSK